MLRMRVDFQVSKQGLHYDRNLKTVIIEKNCRLLAVKHANSL